MKKVLLGTAAVALGLVLAAPAHAEVKLGLGGHFKGYVFYADQDDRTLAAGTGEAREFDIVRETEIHFSGETTLDNGLTVGVHHEADIDAPDAFTTEESYAYFSGAWGRVNFGKEDGAAYLLQVAAPSADDNYDGIRQYVNPFNNQGVAGVGPGTALDYDNDATGTSNKLTYLSPVFSGFQAGFSYTPDVAAVPGANFGAGVTAASQAFAANIEDVAGTFDDAWEASARYDGQFDKVGFTLGAGWTTVEYNDAAGVDVNDDFEEWNVGLDLNFGAFGLGAVYTENNGALDNNGDSETWVVGGDYTTGPYKLGVSYLNNETDVTATTENETDRYTGGVVYTYGPGLTFRGSVSYVDFDSATANTAATSFDADGTSFLLGTQINF